MNNSKPSVATFAWLKSLAGNWVGREPGGRTLNVHYSVRAHGSVVMEQWQMSADSDALTLYHFDGEQLMATHYCPLGNQPRLELRGNCGETIHFDYVSATNLPDHAQAHQCSFELRSLGELSFWRSESYLENGEIVSYPATYSRADPLSL